MTFFRGTNSESIYRVTPQPVLNPGASAITEGKGAVLRALVLPEQSPAQQREIIGAQLLDGPVPAAVPSGGFNAWFRGNQNEMVAATHPLPFVRSGFMPIGAAPVPSYSLPVLATRQDNNWALAGAAFFYFPAPIPLVYIGPQRVEVRPQDPPDVPRTFIFSPPQPPLIPTPPPPNVRLEQQIPYAGQAFTWQPPIPSVVPTIPTLGQLVVRQEEPSLSRNLIASVTWTMPQIQAPPPPSRTAISTRQEAPPEYNWSYYIPGHVFLQGRQFVLLQDAISDAVNLGYIVGCQTVAWLHDPIVPYGYVISQSIPAGTTVGLWTPITFTASLGPAYTKQLTIVPNVVGLQLWQAQTATQGAQLTLGSPASLGGQQYIWINSPTVPFGYVIAQSLTAGASVPAGSTMQLTLSLGPTPVRVTEITPDFTRPPIQYPAMPPSGIAVGGLELESGGFLLTENGNRIIL